MPEYLELSIINGKTLMVNDTYRKHSEQDAGGKRYLIYGRKYMDELGKEFEFLRMKKLSDRQVMNYIDMLIPLEENATLQQVKNIKRLQEDMKMRYFDAPDLQDVGKNAYRFVNAVSDFAIHAEPLRKTTNYRENIFAKTVECNPMIDKVWSL